jgi:ribosomal protein S18 acetylase RimI-like enzyme
LPVRASRASIDVWPRGIPSARRISRPSASWYRGTGAWKADGTVGDIAWNLCQWSERSNAPAAVWEGSDGSAASAAWVDDPSALNLVVDRQRPELVEDVVTWFEDVATERLREVTVLEHEMDLIGELERRGYERADGPFFVRMRRDLVDVPAPQDRQGFRVRAIQPADIPARVRVHRAAWEPSKVTEESYRRLTRCWQYRFELDWVVETEGLFVAECLAWLDDVHGVGELEPVGTIPRFRRMGLGRAVCLGAMQALLARGARTVVVYARGDEAYPIPAALYRSLGFEVYARTLTYRKEMR